MHNVKEDTAAQGMNMRGAVDKSRNKTIWRSLVEADGGEIEEDAEVPVLIHIPGQPRMREDTSTTTWLIQVSSMMR